VSPIVFTTDDDPPLRIELRDHRDNNRPELHCEVTADFEPNREVLEAFESLAADRLPPGSTPPEKWSNRWHNSTPPARAGDLCGASL
jgi:hypothetical protein